MIDLAVSRRAVTRALFTSPILALPDGANAAVPCSVSPDMASAISAYREAEAVEAQFSDEVYMPAWKAWQAEVERIPHRTTKTSMNGWASFDHLSTADRGMVKMARAIMKDAKPGSLWDYEVACAELIEAEGRRQAESNRLAAQYNIKALRAEDERLGRIRDDLLEAIETFPVMSAADLIAKIEIINETRGQIEPVDLLVDLRRISGRV